MAYTFLIRDTLTDTGVGPTDGTVYMSPDILPNGNATITPGTIVSTYNETSVGFGEVFANSINQIFVRAKNLSTTTQSGAVALYWAPSSLFAQPLTWSSNTVTTNGGKTTFVTLSDATTPGNGSSVAAGDIAYTSTPFVLTSLPPLGANQHYCFIAISGPTNAAPPVPTSNFTSNASFVEWVEDNANVAWLNFSYIAPSQATKILATQYGNANNSTDEFFFGVTAQNCPTGTTISFADPSCSPPVSLSATLGAPNSNGEQLAITSEVAIPANYSGIITVQATAPAGKSFPANWQIAVEAYQVVNPDTATRKELQRSRPFRTQRKQSDGKTVLATTLVLPMGQCTMLQGKAGGE